MSFTPTPPPNTSSAGISSANVRSQMAVAAQRDTEPSVVRIKPSDYTGEHRTSNLLDDENWQSWHDDIRLAFSVCGLTEYIEGSLKCPNISTDPISTSNWRYNDDYTKKVIRDRLKQTQKYHTANCRTSHEMWKNLESIHQSRGYQTKSQLVHELIHTRARKGADVLAHLANYMKLWNRITSIFQNSYSEDSDDDDEVPFMPRMLRNYSYIHYPLHMTTSPDHTFVTKTDTK